MNIAISVLYIFPIMLTLCLMLSMTHYAQNYAGIIGKSLHKGLQLMVQWIRSMYLGVQTPYADESHLHVHLYYMMIAIQKAD